jgi:hypothetical protein
MGTIPKKVQGLIKTAFSDGSFCLIGSVLPNGFAQVTPRGSTWPFDDDHIMLWERGRGSTHNHMKDGEKLTVFYMNLGKRDVLPIGGLARLYGTAQVYKSGPIYDKVWELTIEPEKKGDPEKKGYAVLIKIERTEDLLGQVIKD